ncbi:MAG TPA: MaoC/PaaZ C-terminal domain-containing protein [Thermoanaerobaculia bacterium]|nr:MaoC/PaaZ C-terminal domain-containing protein [Thermoanaerobaculia bacterium]
MPIDAAKAVGARLPKGSTSWTADDVILYHLGIGAGTGAGKVTDRRELEYTYERYLKVLPSFGVVQAGSGPGGLGRVPGISINFALVLHGEQAIEIHRPIPVAARAESTARVAGIYDKGRAALIVIESVTREKGGEPLFTNRFSIFARGEGGFGGDPGPKPGNEAPARAPDLVVESPTLPYQALLYRLNGDKNPLHVDPEFAKLGGFDTPILHGLCSYGIVCKAVVDAALDGAVDRVAAYQARFTGVVYPGETIVTSMWREDGRVLLQAKTAERGSPVLGNAAITLR